MWYSICKELCVQEFIRNSIKFIFSNEYKSYTTQLKKFWLKKYIFIGYHKYTVILYQAFYIILVTYMKFLNMNKLLAIIHDQQL